MNINDNVKRCLDLLKKGKHISYQVRGIENQFYFDLPGFGDPGINVIIHMRQHKLIKFTKDSTFFSGQFELNTNEVKR